MYVLEILGKSPRQATILYFHGFLGNHRNFRRIATLLGESYDHLLVDIPFHGRSQMPIEPTFESICGALQRWIAEQQDRGPLHLIGHSFGGRLLMCLDYATLPEVVSVVIEDISPDPIPVESKQKLIQFLGDVQDRSWPDKKAVGSFLKTYGFGGDIALLLLNYFEKQSGHIIFGVDPDPLRTLLVATDQLELWDQYRRVSVPLCVVRGAKSAYLSPQAFEKMGRENKNARLVTCPGAGHWVHIQEPQWFCDIVQAFLKQTRGK